jgi:hypothetical protein
MEDGKTIQWPKRGKTIQWPKRDKRTNRSKNTSQKNKIEQHEPHYKPGMNSGTPKG